MKAVIMAGGKGTRLQEISKDIPKPMFPIASKPILEYQIDSLKKSGITDIIIVIGYLGEVIRNYFGDGSSYGVNISYIVENEPLGTAGALYYLNDMVDDCFILVFGDLILDIDWNRFARYHENKKSGITLFAHPNSHPYDSDVLLLDKDNLVTGLLSKKTERAFDYHNVINAGIYCIDCEVIKKITSPQKLDLEKDIILSEIDNGSVYAYLSTEYVKDMGTVNRLEAVTRDIQNGIVEARSYRNKQKAIFLDRDGTINELRGFINHPEDFELLDKVSDAIRLINSSEYLAIVVTNQPVIARGECSFETLDNIHARMETFLGNEGAYIDGLFFCPHHPDKGFEGEVKELKIDCDCRKPKTGMLLEAAKKYNINLEKSWVIGDMTMDIKMGENANMKTVLLNTGMAGSDAKYEIHPTMEADNLLVAVEKILGE